MYLNQNAYYFSQPQKKIIEPEIIIDGNKIDCVNNFNFLGLLINKHLNWNNHIDHISLKISRVIGILTRLRHTVPIDVLLLLYNSLVLPHINYSLLVWGHNPFRITKLKKKCHRIKTFSKIFAHCDPIFKNLRLLKTEDTFKIKQLKFYYKYVKNNLPLYFQNLSIKANNHTHNTRNQFYTNVANMILQNNYYFFYTRNHTQLCNKYRRKIDHPMSMYVNVR